jgi:hypothetical protein
MKGKMPEELDLHQQVSLGDAVEAMARSEPYRYAMDVMKERVYRRWIQASTTEDREICWALAVAHENFDQTLKEFTQRADVALDTINSGFEPRIVNDDAPA